MYIDNCSHCGTLISVDSSSAPICIDCEQNLTCDGCGVSIGAFDYSQTGFCPSCDVDFSDDSNSFESDVFTGDGPADEDMPF